MTWEKQLPNFLCDLHSHTTRSDGADTPQELIDNASCEGMKVLAITDHDIIPDNSITVDNEKVDIVEYAKEKGLLLLNGIELSCETEIEDVHLVCLGCDWMYPYFKELQKQIIHSKIESYGKLVEQLYENGYKISWNEVLDNNGHPVQETQIQKKMIFELMARKGYVKEWKDAKIMAKTTTKYQIKRIKPDPLKVIKEVHNSGGIVILAHPYLICDYPSVHGDVMTREKYIDRLIDGGLDGIEACYTYDKTSYDGKLTKSQIIEEVKDKFTDRVSIISGGSDYHADQKKGVENARHIGECGITDKYFFSNTKLRFIADKLNSKYHIY